MPRRLRLFVPGVSLHVRQRGNNRCAIFGDDGDYESYLLMLRSAMQRHRVSVHGFSLMTTHTHLLLTPTTERGTAKATQQLGVRYVMYFNRKYNRVGTLWTGRYGANAINDERYWLTCLRYIEQNPSASGHLAIVCAVCHDPHSAENEGQLRFPIDSPSENEQLCMKCHHRRAVPEVTAQSVRGPHSPEGPLLLGDAGWIPPNTDITQIETSHGPVGNPKLCATCHVASFTVTDASTGQFTFQATGHLFQAIPCLDASGKPTVGDSCDVSQRSFLACASSS
jgi:predicted CXXCH cytochrome family protein